MQAKTRRRSGGKRIVGNGRRYGIVAKPREWSVEERAAYRERKRSEADAALGEIVEMFTSGELPELVARTMIVRAAGMAPMVSWSLGNQLLAIRAGTTDARGYRQWQEVGRHVKKGARSFRILGPVLAKREEKDAATGETRARQALVGYRMIPVFRIQDTDGMPLVEPVDYTPSQLPPLYDVAARLGVRVSWMPAHQLAPFRGFYAPGRHEIALLTHDVEVWFHELAHAAHDSILRGTGRSIEDMPEADREIVAETVAATLCHLYDYSGAIFHGAEYVAGYADGGNPGRAAMRVLGDIQRTLYAILDPPEWSAVPAGERELAAA
jgi:hypothetical protein